MGSFFGAIAFLVVVVLVLAISFAITAAFIGMVGAMFFTTPWTVGWGLALEFWGRTLVVAVVMALICGGASAS